MAEVTLDDTTVTELKLNVAMFGHLHPNDVTTY